MENKHEYGNKIENTYPKKFIKVISKSRSEDIHYSAMSDDLPEEINLNALRDVNETEESKAQGIRTLRKFIKENDLKCTDDDILVTVLRHCKYDMKKSEAKLESYLKVRQMVSSKLRTMDLKTIESLMDEMPFGMLPYRDKYGRILLYTRSFIRVDCYDTDFIAVCAVAMLLFALSLPMTSAIGICYISECKYSSVYEYYTTLKYFRRFLACVFDIPLRIRSVEMVNEHFICRWFYNALRPVLPEKLTGRISFLGSGYKKLHKILHPNLLPEEFGGTLGPMNDKIHRQKILAFMEKLKAEY